MDKILFATKDKKTASQQLTKRAIRPREYAPTGGVLGTYQGDLVFFEDISRSNHGYKSILTVISANSRFVYAEPLKKKSDTHVAMEAIIGRAKAREPIAVLWTDPGTEFTAKAFTNLMKKNGITHHLTDPKNHAPLGRIDRFHLTLRTILQRWFIQTGKNNWVDQLPKIIDTYNSRESRATGLAPVDTTAQDIKRIQQADQNRALRVATKVDKAQLTVGTPVRHITNRTTFVKGSAPKWSSGVHPIESRIGVDTFKIRGVNGTFKNYELQKVAQSGNEEPEPDLQTEKAEHRSSRRLKREGVSTENILTSRRR